MVTHLAIEGMSCPNCVRHVEHGLRAVPGVVTAIVDLDTNSATVTHSGDVTVDELLHAVVEEGYRATAAV